MKGRTDKLARVPIRQLGPSERHAKALALGHGQSGHLRAPGRNGARPLVGGHLLALLARHA